MTSNGATESASKVEADSRKIFVGGIHREATQEELRAFMEQFGAVKDATIKLDPMGMSRGFGFVLFEEEASVDACLAAGELKLKDKKMEGEIDSRVFVRDGIYSSVAIYILLPATSLKPFQQILIVSLTPRFHLNLLLSQTRCDQGDQADIRRRRQPSNARGGNSDALRAVRRDRVDGSAKGRDQGDEERIRLHYLQDCRSLQRRHRLQGQATARG